ncbi:MAG: hypothetical protein L0Y44_06710 [Phycisphaerales bacterium]|nr:hypothetical protein [Phycisphaerales bacterium]MCI0676215.1 hypothetical protein [Phycisphaerales bacterium]
MYSYAFGALDALAQVNQLGQAETLAAAYFLFTDHFELRDDECTNAVREAMEAATNPISRTWVEAGGQAILQWPKQDQNAPLRLFELLQSMSVVTHSVR